MALVDIVRYCPLCGAVLEYYCLGMAYNLQTGGYYRCNTCVCEFREHSFPTTGIYVVIPVVFDEQEMGKRFCFLCGCELAYGFYFEEFDWRGNQYSGIQAGAKVYYCPRFQEYHMHVWAEFPAEQDNQTVISLVSYEMLVRLELQKA